MANHKSAIKRNRQNIKIRERNKVARTAVRTAIKKANAAVESKSPEAKELLRLAERAIAKAATKGLVHRKNAQRKISRLASRASAKK